MSLEMLVALAILQGVLSFTSLMTGLWLFIERLLDHAIYKDTHPVRFTRIRYSFAMRSIAARQLASVWVLSTAFFQLTFVAAQLRLWYNLDRLLGASIVMLFFIYCNIQDVRKLEPSRKNFENRYVDDVEEASEQHPQSQEKT